MKILIVNTYHYRRGGDCTYTFALADTLRAHGNDVFFFGMKHPLNYPCPQDKYFVDYIDFVEANSNRNIVNAVQVVTRSIYSVHARRKISQLLDDLKPDIAHFQNIHAHLTPSIMFELKKRGIPIVWTLHDYKIICPNTTFLSHGEICERCKKTKFYNVAIHKCKKNSYLASTVACLESYAHRFLDVYKMVNKLIAPSKFLMNKFIEFGFAKDKLVNLPYLLNPDQFKPTFVEGDYCIFSGRLSEEKGVMTLLKAMKLANRAKLLVVGDGRLRKEFEDFVVVNKVDNVSFVGYKSGNELASLIGNAMFCVVPSEWYENYAFSAMEAMMMGKPIVATNIGGLPELVEDGINGFLVEPRNHVELGEKIKALAGDEKARKTMGKHSVEKAKSTFDPESHYRRLFSIYEEFVK